MAAKHVPIIASVVGVSTIILGSLVYAAYTGKKAPKKPEKRIPHLTLYYFDLPGKGEAIRLLCAYANLPLKDVRISRDDFIALKQSGRLAFGQVPALVVDDEHTLVQSAAIMRYLGKLSGLYPSCPIQAAKVDAIIDEEIDLFTGLGVSRYQGRFGFGFLGQEENKEVLAHVRHVLNVEVLPRHLGYLETYLKESTTGWIAGTTEPSVVDFILVPRLQWLESGANDGISADILKPFPLIIAFMDKFMSLPQVKEYYTKFPTK